MNNEQLLAEIREANLTYLMLAQTLIRQDKAEAVFRLGLNEESCDLLAALSAAQVLKLASRNTLLASFRVVDEMVCKPVTCWQFSEDSSLVMVPRRRRYGFS